MLFLRAQTVHAEMLAFRVLVPIFHEPKFYQPEIKFILYFYFNLFASFYFTIFCSLLSYTLSCFLFGGLIAEVLV